MDFIEVIERFLVWYRMPYLDQVPLFLEVLERITWPIVFLIVLCMFRQSIVQLLQEFARMINRIERIDIKDLSLLLINDKVPVEVKVSLTQSFIREQKTIQLSLLLNLIMSLRRLQFYIKENTKIISKEIIDKVIYDAERMRDALEDISSEKAEVLKEVIRGLRKRPANIIQQTFPIIDALLLLDMTWREKDPEEFEQLQEIRKVILGK